MSNIPTPFVGGTDSPRRGSDEEQALQPPYAPRWQTAPDAEADVSAADEETGPERAIQVEIGDLDEEDLLPDMSAEGEEIAIEGPTYDLEWPEGSEPETPTEPAEVVDLQRGADEATTPEIGIAAGTPEIPDFLLGPDSGESELAVEAAGKEAAAAPEQGLIELSLNLQEGPLGESIRELVADLSVYTPEIAVPRAFAAGYLAAKKEEEK